MTEAPTLPAKVAKLIQYAHIVIKLSFNFASGFRGVGWLKSLNDFDFLSQLQKF